MDIPKELIDDIHLYCNTNNITEYNTFIIKCLRQGFTVEKYGSAPAFKEKIVEKIVEKIIEVPITPIGTEKDEKYKQYLDELSRFRDESLKLLNANEELKAQLAEKNKKKRDLYGE